MGDFLYTQERKFSTCGWVVYGISIVNSRYAMLCYSMPRLLIQYSATLKSLSDPTSIITAPSLIDVSTIFKLEPQGCRLVGAVVGPVNAGNILVAVGELSEGVVGATALTALGQKRDIGATLRGGLTRDLGQYLHATAKWQGVQAGVEALAADGVKLGDGVGERSEAEAGLAHAGVDAHGGLAVGAGGVDGEAGGEQRGALVGEDVGVAVVDILGSAVDVEDAARGGGVVGHEHGEVLASANVVGGQDEVVDGWGEVIGGNVGDQAEVLGGSLGRVDWERA